MLEEAICRQLWVVLPVPLLLFLSDHYLTILAARYLKEGAGEHIQREGSYELTPAWQDDVDALRLFSPKFLRAALSFSLLIVVFWFVSRENDLAMFFFRLFWGGHILLELCIHIRHARNITLFRCAKTHQGVRGRVWTARWLSYRQSAVQLLAWCALLLVLHLLTGSVFVLGGGVMLGCTSLSHWKLSQTTANAPASGRLSPSRETHKGAGQ